MWRKGQVEGIKNIFYGNQIFDSQLCSAATNEKKLHNRMRFYWYRKISKSNV